MNEQLSPTLNSTSPDVNREESDSGNKNKPIKLVEQIKQIYEGAKPFRIQDKPETDITSISSKPDAIQFMPENERWEHRLKVNLAIQQFRDTVLSNELSPEFNKIKKQVQLQRIRKPKIPTYQPNQSKFAEVKQQDEIETDQNGEEQDCKKDQPNEQPELRELKPQEDKRNSSREIVRSESFLNVQNFLNKRKMREDKMNEIGKERRIDTNERRILNGGSAREIRISTASDLQTSLLKRSQFRIQAPHQNQSLGQVNKNILSSPNINSNRIIPFSSNNQNMQHPLINQSQFASTNNFNSLKTQQQLYQEFEPLSQQEINSPNSCGFLPQNPLQRQLRDLFQHPSNQNLQPNLSITNLTLFQGIHNSSLVSTPQNKGSSTNNSTQNMKSPTSATHNNQQNSILKQFSTPQAEPYKKNTSIQLDFNTPKSNFFKEPFTPQITTNSQFSLPPSCRVITEPLEIFHEDAQMPNSSKQEIFPKSQTFQIPKHNTPTNYSQKAVNSPFNSTNSAQNIKFFNSSAQLTSPKGSSVVVIQHQHHSQFRLLSRIIRRSENPGKQMQESAKKELQQKKEIEMRKLTSQSVERALPFTNSLIKEKIKQLLQEGSFNRPLPDFKQSQDQLNKSESVTIMKPNRKQLFIEKSKMNKTSTFIYSPNRNRENSLEEVENTLSPADWHNLRGDMHSPIRAIENNKKELLNNSCMSRTKKMMNMFQKQPSKIETLN